MTWLAQYLLLLVAGSLASGPEGQCLLQTFLQRHSGESAVEISSDHESAVEITSDRESAGRRRRRRRRTPKDNAATSRAESGSDGPRCTTGNLYNPRQTAVYGCRSDILSEGTKFCVNGETFTVGSSFNTGKGATVNLADGEKFAKGLFTKGDTLTLGVCTSVNAINLVHGRSQVNASSQEHHDSASPSIARRTGKFRKLGDGWCMAENGLPKLYADSVVSREFCEAACGSAAWCQAYHFGENANCALFVSADAWDDAPPPGFTLDIGIGAAEVITTDSAHIHSTCYKSIDA
jgi:hypothetical protein